MHESAVAARQFMLFLCGAVLIGALLAAGVGLSIGRLLPAAKPTAQSCPSDAVAPVVPAEIKLTVYNSTSISGLAAGISQQLTKAGMTVLKVGDRTVPSAVELGAKSGKTPQVVIAASADAATTAATLQGFFPESVVYLNSGPSTVVDLYLMADKTEFRTDPGTEPRLLSCTSS